MRVRIKLDWMKEWRCCTDQKTEYRTAQAAMRVTEVFMVELTKKYLVRVGVGVIDEYLVLESWSPVVRGFAASVDLTIDGREFRADSLLRWLVGTGETAFF